MGKLYYKWGHPGGTILHLGALKGALFLIMHSKKHYFLGGTITNWCPLKAHYYYWGNYVEHSGTVTIGGPFSLGGTLAQLLFEALLLWRHPGTVTITVEGIMVSTIIFGGIVGEHSMWNLGGSICI